MTAKFQETLFRSRQDHSCMLPLKSHTQAFASDLIALLFPHFCERRYASVKDLGGAFHGIEDSLKRLLRSKLLKADFDVAQTSAAFMNELPKVYERLLMDAEAIFHGDPAARSIDEVILAYPGFTAITIYRFAHELHTLGVPIIPRILTEYAHQMTGVDIHPGAVIGRSFCIDHGTGIVIGETSVVGERVKIYQGVTLGALSVRKDLAQTKRHPTIEDDVVIYAQAVILGGATTVGHHSVIGGNVWLTESVEPYSLVVHRSEVHRHSLNELTSVLDYQI